MTNNETVAEIVKRVRRECSSYPLPANAAEMLRIVREISAAHNTEIDSLRGELKRVYRVLWNCASAGWECENCRRDCGLHKMGIVKMPEG